MGLRIDLLARWLTGRVAAWLDALGALLLLLFFCILAWRIGIFAGNLMDQGRTTVILGWPQAPFKRMRSRCCSGSERWCRP